MSSNTKKIEVSSLANVPANTAALPENFAAILAQAVAQAVALAIPQRTIATRTSKSIAADKFASYDPHIAAELIAAGGFNSNSAGMSIRGTTFLACVQQPNVAISVKDIAAMQNVAAKGQHGVRECEPRDVRDCLKVLNERLGTAGYKANIVLSQEKTTVMLRGERFPLPVAGEQEGVAGE